MSTIAWEAASDLVSELPANLLRTIVVLYAQYDALNRNMHAFGAALDEYKAAATGSSVARDAETMMLRILDVFNTGLDSTLKRGQQPIPRVAKIARIKETAVEKAQIANYSQVAVEHMAMRQLHLEALRASRPARPPTDSPPTTAEGNIPD
jgi:hypothetical protein